MYMYTWDGERITSYGLVEEAMTKAERKAAEKAGFYFTDRKIINDYNGNFYFEDELPQEKREEIYNTILNLNKDNKLQDFKMVRDAKEREPITTEIGVFDADDVSLNRIRNEIIVLDEEIISWTLADNTIATVTAKDLKNVIKKAVERQNKLHEEYAIYKAKVLEAKTEEELTAIDWL